MKACHIALACVLVAVISAVVTRSEMAAKAETPHSTSAEFVVAGVRNNYSRIISGRGLFRVSDCLGHQSKDSVAHYCLAFDGPKFKETFSRVKDGNTDLEIEVFYDGAVSGCMIVTENRASVQDGWSDDNVVSAVSRRLGLPQTYMLGADSLVEEIEKSKPTVAGRELIDGVECDKLEAVVDGRKQTWWVAPGYGFAVVKSETELEIADTAKYASSTLVTRNSKFVEYGGGIWLPHQQDAAVSLVQLDGVAKNQEFYSLSVVSLDINSAVSPTEFRLSLREDTDMSQPPVSGR